MNHQKSQEFGVKLLNNMKDYTLQFKNDKTLAYDDLKFLDQAVETIINARRCLKNTYVFGFYMIECGEKPLFEYHQFLLDRDTDRLHGMMEGDLIRKLLLIDGFSDFHKCFNAFRDDVINLLSCINKYKENLLNHIENQMLDKIDFKQIEK